MTLVPSYYYNYYSLMINGGCYANVKGKLIRAYIVTVTIN